MKKGLCLLLLISGTVWSETNSGLLQRLIQNEKHGKVIATFDKPSMKTSILAEFDFPEMELRPEDIVYFMVPDDLSKLPLSQIGFSHRQKGYAPDWDRNPGLTSALLYSTDIPNDEFRYWAGHASGKMGAKYAEYRRSPEMDTLYEWPLIGHKGLVNNRKDKSLIRPNVLRIQNVGTDNVYLSRTMIEIIPRNAAEEKVFVFTPRSSFGDTETMTGREYGGGQRLQGIFPNALRVSSYDHRSQPDLPQGFTVNKNQLTIDLPQGKKFSNIAIMCGDTHPNRVRNQDNGWGSLGNASLTITIENEKTKESRILLKDKNVGPEGVITAAEINNSIRIKDGDKLVITNRWKSSTVYIMAIKMGINP